MNNAIKTLGRILKQCCRVRYLIGVGVVISASFCLSCWTGPKTVTAGSARFP